MTDPGAQGGSHGGRDPDEEWEPLDDEGGETAAQAPGEAGLAAWRRSQDKAAPWYSDGLRFECTACGKCCRNHGDGYEYVYASFRERKALAARFELGVRRFEQEYCDRVQGGFSFKSVGAGCVFLDKQGQCSVYELRPKQCRTFPFWPEVLADRDIWERDVASFCPGVGSGPLHGLDEIKRRMTEAGP